MGAGVGIRFALQRGLARGFAVKHSFLPELVRTVASMTDSNGEMSTADASTHSNAATQGQRTQRLEDATPHTALDDAQADPVSGSAPEGPDTTEEDGTPVENPSG